MRNRRSESALIKKKLKEAFPDALRITVSAGKGTAYGWWECSVDIEKKECHCVPDEFGRCRRCHICSEIYDESYQLAISTVKNSGASTSSFYCDDGTEISSINASINLIDMVNLISGEAHQKVKLVDRLSGKDIKIYENAPLLSEIAVDLRCNGLYIHPDSLKRFNKEELKILNKRSY